MEAPDFRALFESAPGLYLVLLPDLRIAGVSNAYLRATLTERASILGRGIFDVFPDNPDDAKATGVSNLRSSLERVLTLRCADTMAVQKYDIRRPDADGGGFEVRYWSPMNTPVLDAHGAVRYIIHRVEDVTDYVKLKLQGSEQERAAAELRRRAEVMEAEVFARAQEIQETNRQLRQLQEQLEARVQARTEELHSAHAALTKSEEQLRQSQKLEAIGRLAGGIAHDFNNLLTVILSYADLACDRLGSEDPIFGDIKEIERAGTRAAALTKQMLAFSRQQVLEAKIVNVNESVTQLSNMLSRVLGEDMELSLRLAPDLVPVKVDPSQLEQVVMNLAVNARDAMPRGGKLTIETSNVVLNDAYVADHVGACAGPHVLLAVSDTGMGMDKATQARVFEPFFTTKPQGKGTGLGLSMVFGIVKQSGGHIWLYSEPGVGTVFKIYLPQAEDAAVRIKRTIPAPHELRGTETVLLAEDEEQVRTIAANILQRLGYTVLIASTANEALALAKAVKTPIDLLLTDVVMPAMSGRQLAEQVAILHPRTKTLFMSGYTDDAVVLHGVLESEMSFLQKPFTPDSLGRKVRQTLDD